MRLLTASLLLAACVASTWTSVLAVRGVTAGGYRPTEQTRAGIVAGADAGWAAR